MITEGNLPNAVMCDDGTYEADPVYCDDGSSGIPCDSTCVLENIGTLDRITEAYMDVRTLAVFMFAPFCYNSCGSDIGPSVGSQLSTKKRGL